MKRGLYVFLECAISPSRAEVGWDRRHDAPRADVRAVTIHPPVAAVTSTTCSAIAKMNDYEEAVLFTLSAYESRLDRVEYCLSGLKQDPEEKPRTLHERVQRIERQLQELSAKTSLLNEVQELGMYLVTE